MKYEYGVSSFFLSLFFPFRVNQEQDWGASAFTSQIGTRTQKNARE
jgi:hypothetical protein